MRDDQKRCTTDGKPPIDPKGEGAPGPINPETGQHTQYWVLCEEERAKGFIRPFRDTYVHKGIRIKGKVRLLTDDEKTKYADDFVAFDVYPESERGIGRLLVQKEYDSVKNGYYGGCGVATKMGQALSETYARDPKFYGATFCCGCGKHFPVSEFVWDDGEVVGS